MRLIMLLLSLYPPALGSDDFRTRERATQALDDTWPASALLCYNGLRSPDPEIRKRCREIISRHPVEWVWHVYAWGLLLSDEHPEHIDPRAVQPLYRAACVIGVFEPPSDDYMIDAPEYMLQRLWVALGRISWG